MTSRRFSRLNARLSARRNEEVAISGLETDLAVPAAEVNERLPFFRIRADHFAHENRVVAPFELLADAALEPRDRTADQRHAELAMHDLRAGELVLGARG